MTASQRVPGATWWTTYLPEYSAQDTAPYNPIGADHELRDAQIRMRLAGIEEVYSVL